MKYYFVSHSEDGDWSLNGYESMDQVCEDFDLYGDVDDYKEGSHPAQKFTDTLNEYRSGVVLIKGEILMPKAVEKIKAWTFE